MAIENTKLGKGIPLSTAFDLQTNLPLDSRAVVLNEDGLQALIDNNAVYKGMIVYCEANKTTYQYTPDSEESSWIELKFTDTIADLTDYATKDLVSSKANADDVYTKQAINEQLNAKANASDVYGKDTVDELLKEVNEQLASKADKATTLKGYGITDSYTQAEIKDLLDAKVNVGDSYSKKEVDDKLAGYATTDLISSKADASDVYTKQEINEQLTNKADKATTLAGYGITDSYTVAEINQKFIDLGQTGQVTIDTSWENIKGKPNTLEGYGITDAYTQDAINELLNNKANVDGVYTKDEADSTFLKKTDNVLTEVSWSDINSRPAVLDNLHSNENNRVYFQNTNQIMAYLSDLSSYVSGDTFSKKVQELEEKIAAGGGGSGGGSSATVTPEGTLVFTPAAAKVENGILEI